MKYDIGFFDCCPGTRDADSFDFVAGLLIVADSRSINHMNRNAFDLNCLRDTITGGARYRGDDCHIGTRQCI